MMGGWEERERGGGGGGEGELGVGDGRGRGPSILINFFGSETYLLTIFLHILLCSLEDFLASCTLFGSSL